MTARTHAAALLCVAERYISQLNDPSLVGYTQALIARVEKPLLIEEVSTTESRLNARQAIQTRGWQLAQAAWIERRDLNEIFQIGINTGIDSLAGELEHIGHN